MSRSLSSGLFLPPFEEFDGSDDGMEGLASFDVADDMSFWGADDFFVGRRYSGSGSNESSHALRSGQDGLRIVESDSDTDTDEQIVAVGNSPVGYEADPPFYWECLHVEDEGSDPVEDFEWEDVSGRVDEREIVCLTAFADDDGVENPNPNTEEDASESNVDWEVLLSINDNDSESAFIEDQEGYAYTSEYEFLFGQFADHDGSEWMRCRPTTRSAIESLPSVHLTAADIAKENTHCPVCKDEISLSEEVKALPCSHFYHEYCIVPWLEMRNTCPICRFELPSGDTNGATDVVGEVGARARFEFEILQDS